MELPEFGRGHDFVPERVSALDPLSADAACARLPEMNARQDVDAMARTLSVLLPSGPTLSGFSYDESLAAMRDLGMFLGSLKRHGVEPIEAVPGLEPVLIELGRRTDMVPRDTIHHFTEMNPSGARERNYTGHPHETCALDTVRIPMRHFDTAIGIAERLTDAEPQDGEFSVLLNELAGELGGFETSMRLAYEKLSPTFFFGEMLLYIDEITVGGNRYVGPSAGHIPLGVLDTLLWESDHGSSDLDAYRRSGLPYTMPRWRAVRSRWAKVPSLTTRVNAAMTEVGSTDPAAAAVRESAAALAAVLHVLVVFRGKHVVYARKGIHDERIDLLQGILDRTREMSSHTLLAQAR